MKWDTFELASIQIAQVLVPSQGDMCTKASDTETNNYILISIYVAFCK